MGLGSENIIDNGSDGFIFNDGRTAKNIHELLNALDYTDDDIFSHHVTPYKNDFSEWLKHSLGRPELAESIRHLNKDAMIRHLRNHLSPPAKEEPQIHSKPEDDEEDMLEKDREYIKSVINKEENDIDKRLQELKKLHAIHKKKHSPTEIMLEDTISRKEEIVHLRNEFDDTMESDTQSDLMKEYIKEDDEVAIPTLDDIFETDVRGKDVPKPIKYPEADIKEHMIYERDRQDINREIDEVKKENAMLREEIQVLKKNNHSLLQKNSELINRTKEYDRHFIELKDAQETYQKESPENDDGAEAEFLRKELEKAESELREQQEETERVRNEFLEALKGMVAEKSSLSAQSRRLEKLEKELLKKEKKIESKESSLEKQSKDLKKKMKLYDKEILSIKKDIRKLL